MMQRPRSGLWFAISLALLAAACDTANRSLGSNGQGFDSDIKVPPRNQVSYTRP